MKAIPQEILDIVLGEDYIEDAPNITRTLSSELESFKNLKKEGLLSFEYSVYQDIEPKVLQSFTAWTENYVLFLTTGIFGDTCLTWVKRHPY